jgi:hypothetical protein
MWGTRNKELKSKGKQNIQKNKKSTKTQKGQEEMWLEKKTATEADEATQSINCGEQFHEVVGQ